MKFQGGGQGHTCRIFLRRQESTFFQALSNDQNTPKFHQKLHFYATIFGRRRQKGPRRRQTLKYEEPRSSDPGVSTGMFPSPSLGEGPIGSPPSPAIIISEDYEYIKDMHSGAYTCQYFWPFCRGPASQGN